MHLVKLSGFPLKQFIYLCQFSSTDQEELETDSTVREILDDTNEEVQDVDNILLICFSNYKNRKA